MGQSYRDLECANKECTHSIIVAYDGFPVSNRRYEVQCPNCKKLIHFNGPAAFQGVPPSEAILARRI